MNYPIYRALRNHYGPQNWWPGTTHFEIIVGAILTQNTSWKNVEVALQNLLNAGIKTFEKLKKVPVWKLEVFIKSAGFYKAKARTLKLICDWMLHQPSKISVRTTTDLRNSLLSIKGIGPETADSILLYAFNRCTSVADKYSHRLGYRIGQLSIKAKYDEIAEWVMSIAPTTVNDQNEIHALIVIHSKQICTKKNPRCHECPIAQICLKRIN